MLTQIVRQTVRFFAPKWSVGVLGLLTDSHGSLCVLKHRLRMPDKPWGFPGGFLRWPEEPVVGLSREVREELGLEVPPDAWHLHKVLNSETLAMLEVVFWCKKPITEAQKNIIKLDTTEITDMAWVGPSELANAGGMLSRHRQVLEDFLRSGPSSLK